MESITALLIVREQNGVHVMTTSKFAEAAHHPASMWVSVPKQASIYAALSEAGRFSLSVLASSQRELARRFLDGARLPLNDHRLPINLSPSGFAFAKDCLASTGGEVTQQIDLDTHTLFFADMVEGELDSRGSVKDPLVQTELDA